VGWWSSAIDTLDPDEFGWWYRVSEPIHFRECKACGKRIGEDMPVKHRGCSKCPVDKLNHATSTQGHLCVSADPRRVGGPGGEPTIINLQELRTLLLTQQSLEDQTVWLTTAQADFPVTEDSQEVQADRDRFLGKPVARFLHPAISTFIQERWQELVRIRPQEKVQWEPDPKPMMTNHPTRVTDSNTRISLSEGALTGPCPRDDSGLGWVQIQRKSLLWEEKIEGFSIITSEGENSRMMKTQSLLESTDVFNPTLSLHTHRVHGALSSRKL
jgi:hypothetical protein